MTERARRVTRQPATKFAQLRKKMQRNKPRAKPGRKK
jgi:hypothetical protein